MIDFETVPGLKKSVPPRLRGTLDSRTFKRRISAKVFYRFFFKRYGSKNYQ